MDYGKILTQAWQILWKYKVLWVFGIMAGCGSVTGSGSGNVGSRVSFDGGAFPPGGVIPPFEQLPNWQAAVLIGLMVILFVVLAIVLVLLGTVGRVGVIRGTQLVDQGADRLTFNSLFQEGLRYFWRVFVLNLFIALALIVVFTGLAVIAAVTSVATLGLALFCIVPLLCLAVPVIWLIQIVVEQANVALVVDDLAVMDGLQRGWEVVRDNLGSVLVMGLILILGVGLVGNFVLGLPFGLIAIPLMGTLRHGPDIAVQSGYLVGLLILLVYLPVLIVLSGILRTYVLSGWTLTYLHLTGPAPAGEAQVEGLNKEI